MRRRTSLWTGQELGHAEMQDPELALALPGHVPLQAPNRVSISLYLLVHCLLSLSNHLLLLNKKKDVLPRSQNIKRIYDSESECTRRGYFGEGANAQIRSVFSGEAEREQHLRHRLVSEAVKKLLLELVQKRHQTG